MLFRCFLYKMIYDWSLRLDLGGVIWRVQAGLSWKGRVHVLRRYPQDAVVHVVDPISTSTPLEKFPKWNSS